MPLIAVLAALAVASLSGAGTPAAGATNGCSALPAPSSLGGQLLRIHRSYERSQPDVHKPTITGPVGRVLLGHCGSKRWALASFDGTYNGDYFGTEDQPERFSQLPGKPWRDLGNTGGEPCGSAPTALLEAWKIVRSCPSGTAGPLLRR
jgi:hypothetical protein